MVDHSPILDLTPQQLTNNLVAPFPFTNPSDCNQQSFLGPNANPHLRRDQSHPCVLELCLTTLCSSLFVCEPTLDVPFNTVLHKLTNYTALVCLLFRVEDIPKVGHAAFTLG
eukprot:g39669.t1